MSTSSSNKSAQKRDAQFVACDDCDMLKVCTPISIADKDFSLADALVKRRQPIKSGDHLFSEGEAFSHLFAITSGSFKLTTASDDGQELVIGFGLAGELLGQNAIHPGFHACNAVALEDASACAVPFTPLSSTASQIPSLMQNIQAMMNKECHDMHRQFTMLMARKNAEQRLAAFLLSLSLRRSERGFSGTQIQLAMSRDDIANFLGLRKETLSRLFTKLNLSGLITAKGKQIRLHDIDGLRLAAGLPASILIPQEQETAQSA